MTESHQSPPSEKKKLSWVIYTLCLFFSLLIVVFGVSPLIVSSKIGTQAIAKHLSKKTHLNISIEQLYCAWFSPQSIKGLEITDHKNTHFSIESITVTSSLWDLLITKKPKGKVIVSSPYCQFDPTNFFDIDQKTTLPASISYLLKNLVIQNADIILLKESKKDVEVHKMNLDLSAEQSQSIQLHTKGITKAQAYAGEFDFQLKYSPTSLSEPREQTLSWSEWLNKLDLTLRSKTTNFPVAALEDVISIKFPSLNGLLSSFFGRMLNSDIDMHIARHNFLSSIDLLSDQVKVSLSTANQAHGIALSKPSFLSFHLTPKLYKNIASLFHISEDLYLSKEGYLQCFLENLFIPSVSESFQFEKAAFSGRIASSALNFMVKKINEPINFNTFNTTFSTKDIEKSLELTTQSSINYGGKNPSLIQISCHLNDIFSKEFFLNRSTMSHLKIDISKFPILFLDQLFNQNGKLVALLGDQFSFKTSSQSYSNKIKYSSSFLSPRLHLANIMLAVDESFYLEKPARFLYLPNEETMKEIFNNQVIQLEEIAPIKGQIEAFGLSLQNISDQFFNKLEMQIQIFLDELILAQTFSSNKFSLKEIHSNINVNTTEHIKCDVSSHCHFINDPLKELIFGHDIQLFFENLIDIKSLSNIQLPSITGYASSDRLRLDFDAKIHDHLQKLTFKKPIELKLQLAPELFNSILDKQNHLITYMPYIPLEGVIDLKPLSLNKKAFEDLSFESHFVLKKMDVVNKTWYEIFSFENTELHIDGHAKTKSFDLKLKTYAQSHKASAGMFKCAISSRDFTSFDFYKNNLFGKVHFENFSSNLTDYLLGNKNRLTALLGPSFDLKLHFDSIGSEVETNFEMESPRFYFNADLNFNEAITLKGKPINLSWEINNDTLLALQGFSSQSAEKAHLELASPIRMHGKIPHLYWPLERGEGEEFDTSILKGLKQIQHSLFHVELDLDKAELETKIDQHKIHLEDLKLSLVKDSKETPFVFNVKALVEETDQEHLREKGSVVTTGHLDISDDMTKTKFKTNFVHFPSLILDSFVKIFGMHHFIPSAFLGSKINASVDAKLENLSGIIDCDIDSSDAKLSLYTFLNDGIVKLYKPLQASLKLTPKLSENFLKKLNVNLIESDQPIDLQISDKGFYMPINPFDIKTFQIRDGLINLHQVKCSNVGSPHDVESIFKLNIPKAKNIHLWFAPLEFSLSNGFLNIDRTEILFNQAYQIAVWGRMNLIKDSVNMTLGLTEQSLKEAFGLKGLPKNFVLQIPLEGSLGDVSVNKELAATRIALLLAKTSGATRNSHAIGSIFDVLGELANDQSSVPAPKKPFPWDKAINQLVEEHRKERYLHIIR